MCVKASRVVTSQDQPQLEGPSRSIARGASQGLWCISAVPGVGGLGHAGLEISQRATRAISEAAWDAISISGMTDPLNQHVYRKGKWPPEKRVGIPRVSEKGLCKGGGSPAHSVETDML